MNTDLFIGDTRTPARDGGTFNVINPATGEPITSVADATPAEAHSACEAAQLTVLYDHENRRAKIRTAPAAAAEAWSSERVGGGT